jgi:hypothetical protein
MLKKKNDTIAIGKLLEKATQPYQNVVLRANTNH